MNLFWRLTYVALIAAACAVAVLASTRVFHHGAFSLGDIGSLGVADRQPGASDRVEARSLAGFDRIRLTRAASVDVTIGSPTAVTLVGGAEELADTTTVVDAGVLSIGSRSEKSRGSGPEVKITLPSLSGVDILGASRFRIHALDGGALQLNIDGVADLVADGRADALTLDFEGVGKVDTTALDAREVTVRVEGVSKTRVRASEQLDASIDGLGRIEYVGAPKVVTKRVEGFGSIRSE